VAWGGAGWGGVGCGGVELVGCGVVACRGVAWVVVAWRGWGGVARVAQVVWRGGAWRGWDGVARVARVAWRVVGQGPGRGSKYTLLPLARCQPAARATRTMQGPGCRGSDERQVLTQGGGDLGCPTGRRPHAPPGRSPCRSGVRDEASAHHASRPPVVCSGEGYRDETRVRRGMSQGEI